jgi:hypothetical protein
MTIGTNFMALSPLLPGSGQIELRALSERGNRRPPHRSR